MSFQPTTDLDMSGKERKNLFSIFATGPEALSSYCLMKYTPSKAHIFYIRGKDLVNGNEKNLLLLGNWLHKDWSHCAVYSTACSVRRAQKKHTSQLQDVQQL